MPHKYNAARRHHIPRPKRRVTNWSEYNEALRQRGSLTVWFTDEAIAAWKAAPRTTPGGQPHYSDLAITTALTLRAVFRLPLRQTEGLIGSVLQLLGLDLPVPDFSTLSRRAQTPGAAGAAPRHRRADPPAGGQFGAEAGWPGRVAGEKHGTSKRRSWRKLHIGFDAVTGRIVASILTAATSMTPPRSIPCSTRSPSRWRSSWATAAMTEPTYTPLWTSVIQMRRWSFHPVPMPCSAPPPTPIPPSATATSRRSPGKGGWPGSATAAIIERARVEGQFARWKQVIGDGLRFHSDEARATEVAIAAQVLNRMLDRPNSVRVA